jgi:hypothetical protein
MLNNLKWNETWFKVIFMMLELSKWSWSNRSNFFRWGCVRWVKRLFDVLLNKIRYSTVITTNGFLRENRKKTEFFHRGPGCEGRSPSKARGENEVFVWFSVSKKAGICTRKKERSLKSRFWSIFGLPVKKPKPKTSVKTHLECRYQG